MPSSQDTDIARTDTDAKLRAERVRSDDEVLTRSAAIGEDADAVLELARHRARLVLEVARQREDRQLAEAGATGDVRRAVADERRTADTALAAEHATADAQRLDERERHRAAMVQLLAFERSATDRTLAHERELVDGSVLARQDLLAFVAHDLRNMLSTIIVNASVAVMTNDLRTATGTAATIQLVSAEMADLLDDLLALSSFEAGKLALDLADLDAVDAVRKAVAIHELVANEHGLALAMHAAVPTVLVRADARRLARLLVNLIANSLKYTPAGGRVDVTVSVVGDECEIAVADTGVGIPKDQLHSVFDRFEQVGTRHSTGVGLGLYIARLVADAHGGRIWAESEPSAGATFRLRLPRSGA